LRRGSPSDVNVASISGPEEKECGSALTSFLGGCE
jgi:hypothetical protein